MSLTLSFFGDIGLFESYENSGVDPISAVYLPESDVNIGNLEFIGKSEKNKKKFFDVDPSYFPSLDYLSSIKLEKFHYLGLANNHVMDFGNRGAAETISLMNSKKIESFGYGCNKDFNVGVISRNNISIALIGCIKEGRWSKKNNDGCGPDHLDIGSIRSFIVDNRNHFDHFIIYPHWGSELVDIPNPLDVKLAKELIDSGATAVIGTHSHIIQGIESYKDGFIAYGLGSFIYKPKEELGYLPNSRREYSICIQLSISKNRIKESKIHYYKLDRNCVPQLIMNPSKKEINYFRSLNKNVNNEVLFKRKKYSILLIREIYSMILRFKLNPQKALLHYSNYFRSKVKKIVQ